MSQTNNLPSGVYVLDSHAILAWLQGEPGAELTETLVKQTGASISLYLSWINLGEVVYNLERRKGVAHAAQKLGEIRQLPIALVEATIPRILAAAHVKARYPVSYADAFAIALTQKLNGTLISGDPEIQNANLVPVLWV